MGNDAEHVVTSIRYMFHYLNFSTPPSIYLLGASSGGSFAFEFAYYSKPLYNIDISGVCVQISSGGRHAFEYHIPVIFLHMPRDARTTTAVLKSYRALNTAKICTQEKVCHPKSLLSGDFFYQHGQALSEEDSNLFTKALLKAGYLDIQGMLKDDPRTSNWREVAFKAIPHIAPLKDSLEADQSPISELMNVAWAYHEITDEHIDDVISFFENCKPLY